MIFLTGAWSGTAQAVTMCVFLVCATVIIVVFLWLTARAPHQPTVTDTADLFMEEPPDA